MVLQSAAPSVRAVVADNERIIRQLYRLYRSYLKAGDLEKSSLWKLLMGAARSISGAY